MGLFENNQRRKSANLVTLVFSGIIMVVFFIAVFGWDQIRKALTPNPESMLLFDGIVLVSLMLACAFALLGFYIYNLVKYVKYKHTVPDKFWSAWGITKKILAVLAIVLVVFLFITNLTNTIADYNAGPTIKDVEINQVYSWDGKSASFDYYNENGELVKKNCSVMHELEFLSGTSKKPVYRFYVYENTGKWIAVERVKHA